MPQKKPRRYPIEKKPLTPLQQLFVAEYLKDLNPDAAWRRAGYGVKGGHNGNPGAMLRHPDVAEAVDAAVKARAKRTGITTDWVLQEIQRVYWRCMGDVPKCNLAGEVIGEYEFDAVNATKNLELMGRHLQMFGTKIEVDVPEGSVYAELMEMVRARLARDVTPKAYIEGQNGNGNGEGQNQ